MRQQINLFQAVLVGKSEPLQSRQVVLFLLGGLALLVLLSLLGYWQLRTEAQQQQALQRQKVELEARVAALVQQYPERQKSVLLEGQIAAAKTTLIDQKQLLGYFVGRDAQVNAGMIEVLEGLARHPSQGVWLRRIQLNAADNSIALAGSALRPELVPQYLQSLGEKRVLGGQVFSRLSLTRLQERPGQVDFSLESLAEGE